MLSESIAQRNAIRFRRLYLETISAGTIGTNVVWRLAWLVNLALWTSREIVATLVLVTGLFLVAMPLGSDSLFLFQRLGYFAVSLAFVFLGIFILLLPILFLRVKSWLTDSVSLVIAVVLSTVFAAGCFYAVRNILGVPLEFTFLEINLRLFPLVACIIGFGSALSPYTVKRLTKRHDRAGLINLIDVQKRGKLLSMSAQDHYVAVATTGGTDLLRVTLSAAIDMLEPGIGLQIHRSHWVAISAINRVNEQSRTVELINGDVLPVSNQHLPTLTLELSRKDLFSQQARLFARDVAEVDSLTKLLNSNKEARGVLDKMFLEAFQGKRISEVQRLRMAYQIYRIGMTASAFILAQLALFVGLASLGTYGLYELPWYQPPLFWLFGYLLCGLVTIPAHVLVWYLDLKYGSHGWPGIILHTLLEGTLTVTVLSSLSYLLFGPVMVPYLVFLVSTFALHACHAPVLHACVREHQSFSSWKKALNIPPIVLQLPYEVRGEIICISADNRAVKVKTTTGESAVRKKFTDALEMLGERRGIQVHRSHWVAEPFIKGRRVEGTTNYVELTTGELIPLAAANIDLIDQHLTTAT